MSKLTKKEIKKYNDKIDGRINDFKSENPTLDLDKLVFAYLKSENPTLDLDIGMFLSAMVDFVDGNEEYFKVDGEST